MSRLKLTDMKYGQFRISDIFEIENCKCSKVSELEKGNIPYVGATNRNNGVLSFVDAKIDLITKGNCIAFICDGEGSVGYSIYKGEDFVGSTTIKVGRNPKLNKYNGLFITTVADTVRGKYNFGYKRNETHLKAETLQLPIDLNGNPNWRFMEDYIRQEQKVQAQNIVNYYKKKIIKYDLKILGLEEIEWKKFYVGDLFEFKQKPSKGLNHLKKLDRGGINYLGATNKNNGVISYVESDEELKYDGNCIAFIRNGEGSMGYSVYKKENFIATQDISVGYNANLDEYIGKFITTIADKVRGKYNFGYKRNLKRLKKEILRLPADENGNPNWEYMRMFMKKVESEKISKVLEYLINTYIN